MPSLYIDTEREPVYLKELTLPDATAYFEAVDANRDYLSQFGDQTATKYPDLASVQDSILNPADPNKFRLGIWDGTTFVGSINLTPDKDSSRAEIGYWLDARHTGRGYATLATKALASFFRGKYPKLFAEVVEGNEASTQVLERAGFVNVRKVKRLEGRTPNLEELELSQREIETVYVEADKP